VACAGIIARTHVHTSTMLGAADKKIEEAQKRTEAIEEEETAPPQGEPPADGPPARAP
jgi:hypothetical protein